MADDCSWWDVTCAAQQDMNEGFHDGLENIARDAGKSCAEIFRTVATWWFNFPSLSPDIGAVHVAQAYTMPVVLFMLMAGILSQSMRIILQRKFEPVLDIALGLIKYVAVSTMGIMLLSSALKAGDVISQYWLDNSIQNFTGAITNAFDPPQAPPDHVALGKPFLLIIASVVGIFLGVVQGVMLFMRQGGILVLAVLLLLAAGASLSPATKHWLPKILSTLAALVFYKPMAALIFFIGLTLIGHGNDISTVMTGFSILIIALISLPTMMRFFSFAGANFSGGGGGGAIAGALGAFGGSSMGGGGGGPSGATGAADQDSAVQAASRTENSGPDSAPSGAEAPSSSGGGPDLPGGTGGGPESGPSGEAAEQTGQAAGQGASTAAKAAGPVGAAAATSAQVINQGAKNAGGSMTGDNDEQQ